MIFLFCFPKKEKCFNDGVWKLLTSWTSISLYLNQIFEARCSTAVFMYHVACALNRLWCNRKMQKIHRQLKRVENRFGLDHWVFFHFSKPCCKRTTAAWCTWRHSLRLENRSLCFDRELCSGFGTRAPLLVSFEKAVRWTSLNFTFTRAKYLAS